MHLESGSVLGWRLGRQSLDPRGSGTAVDVVRRVLALRAWPAELGGAAIAARQESPATGELANALSAGDLIRSYAFRGGSYVFAPEVAAAVLSVRTITRIWETQRWQRQGDFAIDDWEPLREALCDALADGPMTRAEIVAHLSRIPALRHLAAGAAGAGADSLYKPLHWWGDIAFGPERDGQSTFRLLRGDPAWPGLPDPEEAGPWLVAAHLAAYGPATMANLAYWLTEGVGVPRRRLEAWVAGLGERVATVSVDGTEGWALADDVDALAAAEPSESVRLLPGFDPWLLGPGTADTRLVAPERRALMSRGNAPVLLGGRVAATWRVRKRTVEVAWFVEAGLAPLAVLSDEVDRLGRPHDADLALDVTSV